LAEVITNNTEPNIPKTIDTILKYKKSSYC